MAELKIGGNDVVKIMYGDKDVSGNQMLEAGTIVYRGNPSKAIHLLSVDSQWDNISKLRINAHTAPVRDTDKLGNIASTIDRSLIELKQSYTTDDDFEVKVVESEANGDEVLSVTASSFVKKIEVMVL